MSRPISLALVTITLGLATASLAACCNALVKRNHIIGEAMKRVPPKVTLILSTNKLLQPAYALCVASGGLIVTSFILLFLIIRQNTLTHFEQKTFFLNPLFYAFLTLMLIATVIPVTVEGRTGHIQAYLASGGVELPRVVFEKQAASLGIATEYWSLGFIKFLVIIPWTLLPFAVVSTFISYKTWKAEKGLTTVHHFEAGPTTEQVEAKDKASHAE